MTTSAESARTLLFVPGSRPDRFMTACRAGADLVILDLEDAVPPTEKARARDAVRSFLAGDHGVGVRINGIGTLWHDDDVAAVTGLAASVMVPKVEAGTALAALARKLSSAEAALIALIETGAGVLDARAIAATPGVKRLAFGSLDLATELGIDPLDHEALAMAHSTLVFASAAAGLVGPIDGVRASVDDETGLREETARARRLGFTGKLCIHPRHIDIVAETLAPSAEQVTWARSVLTTIDGNDALAGVVTVDGAMVDKPVIDRARRILEREDK